MSRAQSSYGATSTANGHAQKSSEESTVVRTKVLLVGLRRSGKTSIQRVIFEKLPAKQTFYLEQTMRIEKHLFDTVIPLEIWDCPGNMTVDDLGVPLSHFAAMIFVIDIRDVYQHAITKLVEFIIAAYDLHPGMNIEVFVHKAEKIPEDDKIENFRQIDERIQDRLEDYPPEYAQMPLTFHLTSVYDHSLHGALSRVLQKLVASLPYLEELLNVFCANSQSPKAFLFDTASRLYVATDASPVDGLTHNLCCDYLQMLNSFGPLYKSLPPKSPPSPPLTTPPPTAASTSSLLPSTPLTSPPTNTTKSSSPAPSSLSSQKHRPFYPSASTLLSPSTALTYHLVTPHLALLALLPAKVWEGKRGLVEYNVVFFREGVGEICEAEREARGGKVNAEKVDGR